MGLVCQTVRIDAPPERVWEVLIDAERLPGWNVDIIRVEEATGPLDRAGAAYTQVFSAGGREMRGRFEVVAAEPFRSRELRASMPMMSRATGRDTLTPFEDGTELTVELEFELKGGRLARLGEPVVARKLEQALSRSGQMLKRLVESSGPLDGDAR